MPEPSHKIVLLSTDQAVVKTIRSVLGEEVQLEVVDVIKRHDPMSGDLMLADSAQGKGILREAVQLRRWPVVVVGESVGEQQFDELLKIGVLDCVPTVEAEPGRLIRTIRRSLREWDLRQRFEKSEAALRDSEQRLRTIVESEPECVKLLDAECTLLDMNPAGLEMIAAASLDQVKGLNTLDLLDPAYHESFQTGVAKVFRGETTMQVFEVIALDGERHWMEQHSVPIWNPDNPGQVKEMLAVTRDITQRKRAEEKLQSAHHRASVMATLGQTLAEGTSARNASLAILDAADQLLGWDSCWLHMWNEETGRFEELTGFDVIDGERQEVAANPMVMRDGITPMDRRVMKYGPQLVLRREAEDATGELVVFGSGRRSLSMIFVPLRAADRLVGIISVQRYQIDAYSQKSLDLLQNLSSHCATALLQIRIQSKLVVSEERFRRVWESTADGLRLTDERGVVMAANPAFCQMMGRSSEEVEGACLSENYAANDREIVIKEYRAVFAERSVPDQVKSRLSLWNGKSIMVDVSNCIIEADSEHPLLLGMFRDVTAREAAQERSLRMQRMESIGNLAGGVAHDLNNALAPILFSIEELRELIPGEDDLLDTLESGGRRAANMVKQLLTFARGVEGKRLLVQCRHLIREMEKIIRGSFPKNIDLEMDLNGPMGAVLGDSTQLHQVLLNLCVNARDAMPNGGTLRLEAGQQFVDEATAAEQPEVESGNFFVWRVKDSGIGMSPATRERIFDPFYSTKGPEKGTGLGLSTTLGIVQSHGGFIRVDSEPGNGTTMSVYLPVSEDVGEGETEIVAAARYRANGETVLVVDDEESVLKVARRGLSRMNLNVVTASNGREGLELAAKHGGQIRLVITDMHMPRMDGVEFIRSLREHLPEVEVIVASGRMEELIEDAFGGLGVTTFVNKPYSRKVLSEAIEAGLKRAG